MSYDPNALNTAMERDLVNAEIDSLSVNPLLMLTDRFRLHPNNPISLRISQEEVASRVPPVRKSLVEKKMVAGVGLRFGKKTDKKAVTE